MQRIVKSLLIGGCGFIGSSLITKLVQSGRSVTSLDRGVHTHQVSLEHVKYVQGDYSDLHLIEKLVADHDEIIHLAYATVPNTSFNDPLVDLSENLAPSVQLFDVIARYGKKLLLISSGGTVYGEAQSETIAENHATNPISPYGVTKLTLEKYAYLYACTKGLNVVTVRPANPYGVGQKPFVGQGFIATAIATVLQNRPIKIFGSEGTVRDYIYIDDLGDGIVTVLNHGVLQEVYNIGSGIGRSNLDVVHALEPLLNKIGYEVCIEYAPERPFDVKRNVLDCKKVRSLGWNSHLNSGQVDFKSGLKRTIDSLRDDFSV